MLPLTSAALEKRPELAASDIDGQLTDAQPILCWMAPQLGVNKGDLLRQNLREKTDLSGGTLL